MPRIEPSLQIEALRLKIFAIVASANGALVVSGDHSWIVRRLASAIKGALLKTAALVDRRRAVQEIAAVVTYNFCFHS